MRKYSAPRARIGCNPRDVRRWPVPPARYSGKKQAKRWPSPASSGRVVRHFSWVFQQRGAKAQPSGTLSGEGSSPYRWIRTRPDCGSVEGVADNSALV